MRALKEESKLLKLLERTKSAAATPCHSESSSKTAALSSRGVSVAYLISSLVDFRGLSTRQVAEMLRNGARNDLETASKPLPRCRTHVSHAWAASYDELVDVLASDAGSELEKRYILDLFTDLDFETLSLLYHIIYICDIYMYMIYLILIS